MAKQIKTNVMRLLEQHSVPYTEHHYFGNDVESGMDVAKKMGNNPQQQFKTLVTSGKSGEHYVFVIPVNRELDLKKAARAVNEKSAAMIKEKDLLPLTGYVHGGCSPIGMKKQFETVFHHTAKTLNTIIFSAGKVGVSVEVSTKELNDLFPFDYADIIKHSF
ncbi:MAG: Cys-tRNA(Pro) deacylase [Alkalibacterium sp.]|nr:Cys-tRNA(Pro) deacylase [Alkalibacterium sp.]TVP91746.1 MAG: Cys-tRNA(Pro) deacylase [Alkalibacterium sp.]